MGTKSSGNTWPPLAALPQPNDFLSEGELQDGRIHEGIYFLLDLDGSVVYVGQSVDIARRLDEHRGIRLLPAFLRSYETSRKDFHRAIWTSITSPSERLRIEGVFVLLFTPRYNAALHLRVTPGRVVQCTFAPKKRRKVCGSPK